MQRITITGSSGYLGQRLVDWFRQESPTTALQGIDITPLPDSSTLSRFDQVDICHPDTVAAICDFQPDTIIHGAFAFRPLHDTQEMRRVNIDGSRNLLAAAAATRPERLLVISSATAYGASPDNPIPMDEAWPIANSSRFPYADDKMAVERLVSEFAAAEPELAVSWVRPSVVAGPSMSNYLSRFIFGMPCLLQLDGYDTPLQFVHEVDVLRAIHEVLARNGTGPFNIGPPDAVPISQVAQETNRRVIRIPLRVARVLHGLAWALRLPIHESPASFLDFARYPWVVSASRLEREFDFQFEYTALETLRETISHQHPARRTQREHGPVRGRSSSGDRREGQTTPRQPSSPR